MRKIRCCFCGKDVNDIGGIQSELTAEVICHECISGIVIFRAANMEMVKKLKELKEEGSDKQ